MKLVRPSAAPVTGKIGALCLLGILTTHGPIVYRLGSQIFTLRDGVRLSVGLLRVGGVRHLVALITQRHRFKSGTRHSGVAQWQSAWPLTKAS